MNPFDDPAELARRVIDANRYLTLGTTGPDGRPRLSPVYFTHVAHRDFYWVSSPDAQHSRNIAAHPETAVVIYDSTAAIGQGRAVYIDARASVVADDELPSRCAEAFAQAGQGVRGARAFEPHELRGDADLRLYHARADRHEVHVPGGEPSNSSGIDVRRQVSL